jgi:hypothetical protein
MPATVVGPRAARARAAGHPAWPKGRIYTVVGLDLLNFKENFLLFQ